jgi:hypothetical protein
MQHASWLAFGIIVTHLAWITHRLVSSNRSTRYPSLAVFCKHNMCWSSEQLLTPDTGKRICKSQVQWILFICLFFGPTGFELRALNLLGKCSTTWAMPPTLQWTSDSVWFHWVAQNTRPELMRFFCPSSRGCTLTSSLCSLWFPKGFTTGGMSHVIENPLLNPFFSYWRFKS